MLNQIPTVHYAPATTLNLPAVGSTGYSHPPFYIGSISCESCNDEMASKHSKRCWEHEQCMYLNQHDITSLVGVQGSAHGPAGPQSVVDVATL